MDEQSAAAITRGTASDAGQGGNATADLGPAAAGAPVSARVYLAGRDPAGLARYAASASYPASPLFHRYLTPAQVRERFGATGSQVAAIRSWLAASGLKITAVAEHHIAVSGTAAAAQAAFGAVWHSYEVDGTTQQAPPPTTQLSAPAQVAPAVLTVAPVETGLPGYPATASAAVGTSPAAARPRYGPGPGLHGVGQVGHAMLPERARWPRRPGRREPGMLQLLRPEPGDQPAARIRADGALLPVWLHACPAPLGLRGPRHADGQRRYRRRGTPVAPADRGRGSGHFRRPARRAAAPGQFTQILPPGLDASCAGTTQGPFPLANEETGDVELVHALAPGANIAISAPSATMAKARCKTSTR